MSLWNTLRKHAGAQLLEVIEWLDDTRDTIVYRFPVFNQMITDQSKLVVREGQAAIFVAEGKLSDVFGPGTHPLNTRNAPIMAFFKSIKYGLNYPFKGDIYFVNTRKFTDQPWGTPEPVTLRDADFGVVRIRSNGVYTYRITDPGVFLKTIVGTDGLFETSEINGQLKKKLVAGFADTLGSSEIPALDMASNKLGLGDTIRERMNPSFEEKYGISLTDFTIRSISFPKEIEEALDARAKMGVLGDMNAYTQLQAAESMQTAAANPGMAGAGVGMGMGVGVGHAMGHQMGQAMQGQQRGQFNPHAGLQNQPSAAPPPVPSESRFHYHGPSGQAELTVAEIASRIAQDRKADHLVWQAGWPGWKAWKEVPEVAQKVPPEPAAPPPSPGADVVFHYHGPAGQGEKPVSEIVAILQDDPQGAHHLWKSGFDDWKPAREVPEVASAMKSVPPPPPR